MSHTHTMASEDDMNWYNKELKRLQSTGKIRDGSLTRNIISKVDSILKILKGRSTK